MVDLFIEWYFFDVPMAIGRIWFNYLWFFERYFALKSLARDFLAPWKGLTFKREKPGFDLTDALSAIFSNLISRLLGAAVRLIFLAIGAACEIFTMALGLAAYVAWVGLIPATVGAFAYGILLLANY